MDNQEMESGFDLADVALLHNSSPEVIYKSTAGYCDIYMAVADGLRIAVKALKPEYRGEGVYVDLLRKEFDIASSLNHPGIVATRGWRVESELGPAILMEYVEWERLSDFLKRNPELSRDEALTILQSICDALAYIHKRGVTHRDLKPENILISHDGRYTKIIDFGLSDTDAHVDLKYAGGTRGYGAPEQFVGGVATDSSVDVYALGMIMRQLQPRAHGAWRRIAAKCLSVNPADRPVNVADIVKSIKKRRRRQSVALGVASGLIMAGLVAAGSAYWGFKRAPKPIDTLGLDTSEIAALLESDSLRRHEEVLRRELCDSARNYTTGTLQRAYYGPGKWNPFDLGKLPSIIASHVDSIVIEGCEGDTALIDRLNAAVKEASFGSSREFYNRLVESYRR